MLPRFLLVPLLALFLAPLTVAADEPLVVPIEGNPFAADFAGAKNGELNFTVDGKTRSLAVADVVTWGRFVDPARGIHVILPDGGLIVSQTVRLDGDNLVGESVTFGKWSLPVDQVAGLILQAPIHHSAGRKLPARIRAASGRDDRLLLDNGDEVTGTLLQLNDKVAVLRVEGEPLETKGDSLTAVVFDPSLASRPRQDGQRLIVGFQDGSRLVVAELSGDQSNTNCKLTSGAELSTATRWIVALQSLGGRVEYLSDLEPASYRHIPYLELTWPFHNDENVIGSQLRAAGQLYLKGLGMHSPARITYDLEGDYRRFDADVAIDDTAHERGSVLFRVFVDDGSGQWQEAATSEIMRGGQAPQSLSADLTGAKRISLLVDFADRGDELDHADWLNARLVR